MIRPGYILQAIRPPIQILYFTAFLAAFLLMAVANHSPIFSPTLALAIISFFLVQSSGAYLLNAFSDTKIDSVNKPERASAKGLITEHELLTLSYLSFIIGIALASTINPAFLAIQVATAIIGTMYSLKPIHLKSRGILCTLTVVYCHLAALLSGAMVSGQPIPKDLTLIIGIQALISFFVAFNKDIPDIKGDEKYGARTLAVELGEKNSTRLLYLLPLIPLLYLFTNQWWIAPLLFLGFIYAVSKLREKEYLKAFQIGVYLTIIQNIALIAFAISQLIY